MKLFILIGVFILTSLLVIVWYQSVLVDKLPEKPVVADTESKLVTSFPPISSETAVFIPYWRVPKTALDVAKYDELIYFGVAPDEKGVLIHDLGYTNIETFISHTDSKKKRLLTVRMLNTENNLDILEDASRQSLVINQTLDLVEQYGFDGVVLDLEVGVIPLENVTNSITTFVSDFAREARTSDVTFAITIYGDSFYRARPYDVEKLAHAVDGIYVMAYDFHKSRGEPGPNFPLTRRSESEGGHDYPYNFQTMIADFTSIVPREKLTILFGMYGYDWTLGPQGLPLKSAVAVVLNEIDADGAIMNSDSREKHILYTDDEGYKHELWYEDQESVDIKIEYLKELGIGSVGYWVWGYF